MGEAFGRGPSLPETSGYLAQLPATRPHAAEVLEHLLQSGRGGVAPAESRAGTEYLLFICMDVHFAVPLKALQEVRPSLPPVVSLPFSPDWLIGIFPLRTQLLALVDPGPLLLGRSDEHISSLASRRRADYSRGARTRRRVSAPLLHASFPTAALLIGEGESVLAWAVTSVGDIAVVPDELTMSTGAHAVPVPEKYVAGVYAPSGSPDLHIILAVEQVQADMLAGLTESEQPDE